MKKLLILIVMLLITIAHAETYNCYVLCQPDSCVIIRNGAGKSKPEVASTMCGSRLSTDQKERNGFVHVFDLSAEQSSGWISDNYVVWSEPHEVNRRMAVNAVGRVAVRKWIDGDVIRWMKPGQTLMVYWLSPDWAVTEYGYVMSEFLQEVDDG